MKLIPPLIPDWQMSLLLDQVYRRLQRWPD